MRWPPWQKVTFLARLNRFACRALLLAGASGVSGGGDPRHGEEVLLHLPNSGRLGELLVPGAPGAALPAPNPHRRTWGDLLAVRPSACWVVVDARLPPLLLLEGIAAGRVREIGPLGPAWPPAREVRLGDSRIDLFFPRPGVYVETKSVTLVREGVALFPDAPTARGRRHLQELRRALAEGRRAAVAFVIQRPDARAFAPNRATDPGFAAELAAFARAGGEVYAYRCLTEEGGIGIAERVPVEM